MIVLSSLQTWWSMDSRSALHVEVAVAKATPPSHPSPTGASKLAASANVAHVSACYPIATAQARKLQTWSTTPCQLHACLSAADKSQSMGLTLRAQCGMAPQLDVTGPALQSMALLPVLCSVLGGHLQASQQGA